MATTVIAARQGRRSFLTGPRREAFLGYLYIAPWIFGFLVFTVGPMIASFYFSLTNYNTVTPARFIGLENYRRLFFDDPRFIQSLGNTLYYVVIGVPLGIVISLAIALMLNQGVWGTRVYRTLFFLPTITPIVASILVWQLLFNPGFGLINYLLSFVGIDGPTWLASETWVKPSLIIIALWGSVGGSRMLIFLAGLQSIPPDMYEAASLDGANAVRRFWSITLPMLSPAIFFNVILSVIEGFRIFTPAYIATQGGPNYASNFFMLYLFNNAFSFLNMGYASAMAWVLFVLVLVLTVFQFRMARRWVYYEGDA
jgi:multiple sugar transport system permease protein